MTGISYHGWSETPPLDMPPPEFIESGEWPEVVGAGHSPPWSNDVQPATDESDGLEPDPRRDERLMRALL
ncbi:hypothetical protein llg_31580 [Luteolibacter sp. LG18]|nr:hypothetical protein llg_31580 [Luteolibacter sp. LG18]